MILILTGASRPQYEQDLINTVCYANGEIISYDYRYNWIAAEQFLVGTEHLADPRISSFPKSFQESIKDQQALVIFYHHHEDSEWPYDEFQFVPVRFVKIVNCTLEFGAATLDLELRDFFRYDSESQHNINLLRRVFSRLQEQIPNRPRPSKTFNGLLPDDGSIKLLVRDPVNPLIRDSHWSLGNLRGGQWLPLAMLLRRRGFFRHCTFLCPHEPEKSSNTPIPLLNSDSFRRFKNPEPPTSDISRAEIRSGSRKVIRIHGVKGVDAPYASPELSIDSLTGTIIGPIRKQRAGGLDFHFEIAFSPSNVDKVFMLKLNMPQDKDDPEKVMGPEYTVDLTIRARNGELVTAVLLLGLGPVLVGLDSNFYSSIVPKQTASRGSELTATPSVTPLSAQNAAPVGLILAGKLIGFLLTCSGAWLLARRGFSKPV